MISWSLKTRLSVWMGCLFGGGVLMSDKSLAPSNENWSVLGIGVAVRVRVSTFTFRFLNFSFAATPNFCSSSRISKPRFLNAVFLFNRELIKSLIFPIIFLFFLIPPPLESVELIGSNIKVENVAKKINTISYEILTSISERVKRIYFQK